MDLVIGNKNYSSWSMRPWLLMDKFELTFTEIRLALFEDGFYQTLQQYTPAGKVPALIDGDVQVWDSLAICEYINDNHLQGAAWPANPAEKAIARAITAEMHSGFMHLRNELPMNCRVETTITPSKDAQKDISRIDALWSQLREQHKEQGPWLFGNFTIADAFYIPVALRFNSYSIEVSKLSQQYIEHITSDETVQKWVGAAIRESERIEHCELG